MSTKVLGLDIGNKYVSAIILDHSIKGVTPVDGCRVMYQIPPEGSQGAGDTEAVSSIKDLNFQNLNLQRLVEELAAQLDLSSVSFVAVSLPGSWFSFRHLQMPFKNFGKIRQILTMELPGHLPLANDDYLFDFFLTKLENHGGGHHDLLTVAVCESLVADLFKHLKSISLRPSLIAPRGYLVPAVYLKANPSNQAICFVDGDSDSRSVTICLAFKGRIVHLRTLDPAPDNKSLSFFVKQTLAGFSLSHGTEFKPALCLVSGMPDQENFAGHAAAVPVQKKLGQKTLSGQVLMETLSKSLECPVQALDISRDFVGKLSKKFVDKIKTREVIDFPENALAAALAATGGNFLNLCRNRYAAHSFLKTYIDALWTVLILCILTFAALLFSLHADMAVSQKKVTDLDQAARNIYTQLFPREKRIVDPLMQLKVKVREIKKKSLSNTPEQGAGNHKVIDLLYELSNLIPKEINTVTSRLVINPGRIIFSGHTDNFNNVDQIKIGLEQSRRFKEVKISNASADKTGGSVRFQFMIQLARDTGA